MQKPLRYFAFVLAGFLLTLVTGLSFWYGGKIALSDLSTNSARWLVRQWGQGLGPAQTDANWIETLNQIESGLQLTPENPLLLEDLGFLYASKAQTMGWPKMNSPEETLRQKLLSQAIDYYRQATVLRPTFPYPWAYIALAKHLQGIQDDEFWLAFDKAIQLGKFADGVQPILAKLAFAQWPKLTPMRRDQVILSIVSAKGKTRLMLLGMIAKNGIAVPGM